MKAELRAVSCCLAMTAVFLANPGHADAQTRCGPEEGIGELCSLPDNACRCGNVCGQSVLDGPAIINHYCFAECSVADMACPGEQDACVALDAESAQSVCLPTGYVQVNWRAKIIAADAVPGFFDYGMLEEVEATLAGVPVPLQYALGMEQTIEGQDYIVFTFQGVTPPAELWAMQVVVPKASVVAGRTLQLDAEHYDFDATLLRGEIDSAGALSRLELKGMASGGSFAVNTASSPGNGQMSTGTLMVTLLGFSAELATP